MSIDDQSLRRRFCVRARHTDPHDVRVVMEATHEAAAVAYVEHLDDWPGDLAPLSIIVRALDGGDEQCFRIDPETGDTRDCQ